MQAHATTTQDLKQELDSSLNMKAQVTLCLS